MKIAIKQPDNSQITPDNIGVACFNGKGMTKAEAIEMQEWVNNNKA